MLLYKVHLTYVARRPSQVCVAGEDRFRAAGWLEFCGSNGLSPTSSEKGKVRQSPLRETVPAVEDKMEGPTAILLESSADGGKIGPQDTRPGEAEPSFVHDNERFPREGSKAKDDESKASKEMAVLPINIEQVSEQSCDWSVGA